MAMTELELMQQSGLGDSRNRSRVGSAKGGLTALANFLRSHGHHEAARLADIIHTDVTELAEIAYGD